MEFSIIPAGLSENCSMSVTADIGYKQIIQTIYPSVRYEQIRYTADIRYKYIRYKRIL